MFAATVSQLSVLLSVSESECYVSLLLPTASSQTYRTRTAKKSRFPEWDETFHFRVYGNVKVGTEAARGKHANVHGKHTLTHTDSTLTLADNRLGVTVALSKNSHLASVR